MQIEQEVVIKKGDKMYIIKEGIIREMMAGGFKPSFKEIKEAIEGYKEQYKTATKIERYVLLRSAKEVADGFGIRDDVTESERKQAYDLVTDFENYISSLNE